MKKVLLILSIIVLASIGPAMAANLKVEAVDDFSTANPSKTWAVKLVNDSTTKDGTVLYSGSIIYGDVVDVTGPKRLKRNATFTFVPKKYYDSNTGETYTIKKRPLEGTYSSRTDITPGSVIKSGAISAGNHFISGAIKPGIALVEGVVKNEEGNRAKSAAVSVYKNSPLGYASKGKELDIKKGQIFVMSFKLRDDEEGSQNLPNYSYTAE